MRTRIGGLLVFASLLTGVASACNTAGVSFIYMAIDNAGMQPRQTFFTDSTAIYCIAKFSSARQDATLDYTIHQKAIYPWCTALKNPTLPDTKASDVHPIFAVGEITPGVGVETAAAAELLPNGIQISVMCGGNCYPNSPAGNICADNAAFTLSAQCPALTTSQGPDSCGIGLTCCACDVASGTGCGMGKPLATVPYPPGEYTCVVTLDGVEAGETDFNIVYPPVQPGGDYCPVAPPVNGVPCYNWVPANAKCAGYEPQTTCVCDSGTGVWACM